MPKIQVHSVQPREDSLRIGVHGEVADAQYVTELLTREPGVEVAIDELATEEQLDGWLYLVVTGASAEHAIGLLRADQNIEYAPG